MFLSRPRCFDWCSKQFRFPAPEDQAEIQQVHREQYTTAVTDAVLLPDKATVAVSLRNTNFLRLFSLETHREVDKVNMNAQGDNHISFTASHLALSPCGKYLLVSTDGARIIMFKIAGWHQIRNFFGLQIESFHQPVTAWHPSGYYFFAAAAHGQVYVFHVGSSKVIATFKPHEKNVRCLDYDEQQKCLMTGSFDRNVQIYHDDKAM
ncbi:hypothetical protein COCOBI_01-3650 [Coccomyxa sp. Obi]|nr:hypothetical protein COCOBI_01-3650 [Coccomyxa sp. Obi]